MLKQFAYYAPSLACLMMGSIMFYAGLTQNVAELFLGAAMFGALSIFFTILTYVTDIQDMMDMEEAEAEYLDQAYQWSSIRGDR